VILFLPRPVTEYELLMDSIKHAGSLRQHKACSRRTRWLKENIGALIFVIALFALTWFIATR